LGVELREESFSRSEIRKLKVPVELPFDPSVETPLEVQVYLGKEFTPKSVSVLENSVKLTFDFLSFCVKNVTIPLPLVGLSLGIEYSLQEPSLNCSVTVCVL
jgi:hypothetical protein